MNLQLSPELQTSLLQAGRELGLSPEQIGLKPQTKPEPLVWETPAHTEIDLATVMPEDLGLDPDDMDSSLAKAIYRAQPITETQAQVAKQKSPFELRADIVLEHNVPVIPLRPKTKIAFIKQWEAVATTDREKIAEWGNEHPDANIASVAIAQPGNVWFLEIDRAGFAAEIEQQTGQKIPDTFMVRSSPKRGHYYFRQTPASIAMGNRQGKDEDGKEAWSARVDNRYVVGPLSIHPTTGTPYEVLKNVPIVEAPDWLVQWCIQNDHKIETRRHEEPDSEEPIPEGSRNSALASILGKARQTLGMDREQLFAYGVSVNEQRCKPPLPESEVRTIANSIGRYEVKPSGPETVILGGVVGGNEKPVNPAALDVSEWRKEFRTIGQMEQGDILMLIDGFLPEGTTFLGALPAHGKTLVALSIARALTTQKPLFGNPEFAVKEKRSVLYLIPETGDRAFRSRCEKFQIPDDETFLCRTISSGASLSLDNPLLLEAVRQLKPVVFLDTAIRFSESADENSAAANKQLVDDVTALRAAGAIAVVLLHHAKKDSGSAGQMSLENMLRGTGDFAAMCDTAYGVRRDDSLYNNGGGPLEINVANIKPRDLVNPPAPFRLAATYKKEGSVFPVSHINETGDFVIVNPEETTKRVLANLLRLVGNNPDAKVKDLAEATGLKEYTIRQELRRHGWHSVQGGPKGSSPWHQDNGQPCPYEKPKKARSPKVPDVDFGTTVH